MEEGLALIHLAAVTGSHLQEIPENEVFFCSYCGRTGGDTRQRVCSTCGLGVRLRTDARALKSPGAPFLIVRADGRISAASATAEREFGDVVGRPLLTVFASPAAEGELTRAVALAAGGETDLTTLPIAPLGRGRFRGSLRATIAPCGDPAAALLVLERA
jgi:ribosomal protein L37E